MCIHSHFKIKSTSHAVRNIIPSNNGLGVEKIVIFQGYWIVCGQPLEFRPHSYFVDFTSRALFHIMSSLPTFVKVGKTPATQNLVLEQ